jgi:hypothetical protein
MNRPADVDRTLESWLAEGPSQLPDPVIDRIVGQIDTKHQRKHWWLPRRETMNRMLLSVGGVAAAVLIAVVGFAYFNGGAGPNVGGVPTPSPSPAPTFTSERHGYSLLLPDETWNVAELAGRWSPRTMFNQDGPGVDSVSKDFAEPGPYILFNSQPVSEGTTLEEWVAAYRELANAYWPECVPAPSETGEVDGEIALLINYLCGDDPAAEAFMLHGGRAYVVRVFDADPPGPRPILDEWLSRFRFTN